MKLQPNSFYRRARAVLRKHPVAKAWNGVVFRSVSLPYAKPEQILDGMGAMKSGGRWNRPGIRALYCSLNPGTAAEESMRLFERAGFKRATVRPRLIVGIRYSLGLVVDLRELLGGVEAVDLAALLAEEWEQINTSGRETLGQTLGRALYSSGVEALVAPSARVPEANNLVVFPPNLLSTSKQEILEEAELKAWLKQ